MTNKDRILLLKDLCARLPYGVKVVYLATTYNIQYVDSKFNEIKLDGMPHTVGIGYIKPYLRPISSMTEEEFLEYHNIKYNKVTYRNNYKRINVGKFRNVGIIPIEDYLDWLNIHHFDYHGLIEKNLALKAPDGMYK